MSYDIYLEINTGKDMHTVVDVGNYTSNVASMWGTALKAADEGKGYGVTCLSDLHDWQAERAIEVLPGAIKHMRDHADEYRAMNPQNGWGNYEGALEYLENLLRECEKHPACTIYISH